MPMLLFGQLSLIRLGFVVSFPFVDTQVVHLHGVLMPLMGLLLGHVRTGAEEVAADGNVQNLGFLKITNVS